MTEARAISDGRVDLKALIEAAKAAPYQGRWIVEENKTSAWVGTPKGTPPFEKCDDVFFGQDLTGYKPEYIERTLALYRFIAIANPSTVAAMAEELLALREAVKPFASLVPAAIDTDSYVDADEITFHSK